MMVEHFGGSVEVADMSQLDEVLGARYGNDVNEFWISGPERFPLLSVQVRGDLACLHFFPFDGHPGLLSVGNRAEGSTITFYTNSPTEEIEVPSESVVPFHLARRAAHEFLSSQAIPSSLQWTEL